MEKLRNLKNHGHMIITNVGVSITKSLGAESSATCVEEHLLFEFLCDPILQNVLSP